MKEKRSWVWASLILLGCAGVATVLVLDLLYSPYGLLGEAPPDFSPLRWVRSAAILLSVCLVALGFMSGWPPARQTLFHSDAKLPWWAVVVAVLTAAVTTALLIVSPSVFNQMSLEDGPIEWASALLLFASSAAMMLSALKGRRQDVLSGVSAGLMAMLAVVFFVIAMEEVSWFQRVFDLRRPEWVGSNEQNELNFHNFATNRIENLYYFGAFLFLVVLPVVRLLFPEGLGNSHLGPLIPAPCVVVIGAIACAHNYDMWNTVFTQVTFFGAIVALSVLALITNKVWERRLFVGSIGFLLIIQAVFLVSGDSFDRLWTITEFKELFIPIGFFAYSVFVYRGMDRQA